MFKKLALSLTLIVFVGMLTACDPRASLNLNKAESTQNQNTNNQENNTKNSEIGAPVALPPQFENTKSNTPNRLSALSPMKGINVDKMFAENIKDTGKRFDRVESAVQDLRKEFEGYKPSIVRLAAVESDIQNLIKELEVLLQETPTPQHPTNLTPANETAQLNIKQLEPQPPPQPKIQSAESALATPITGMNTKYTPTEPPPQIMAKEPDKALSAPAKEINKSPPPKKMAKGDIAQNLRVGEHADKLRIVIDMNKAFKHTIDIDNDEKIIIVEIPDAKWLGQKDKNFEYSKLIESYTIEPINNDKGSMIIIALKKATSIMKKGSLSPDSTSQYHRIYFDLKP